MKIIPILAFIFLLISCGDNKKESNNESGQDAEKGSHFIPVTSYRTGPYAVSGTPAADAMIDYMKLINERDGGINGVKLDWEECETAYKPDRFIECYERLKGKGAKGARARRGPGALGLAPVVATAFFPLINLPNFILASLS